MTETLCSVGLDIGTTTTQLIVSELTAENRASPFAVPDMAITERRIRYRSPIHFTPLLDDAHVDADAIRALVASEYRAAGLSRGDVDTGAVIITGETARKENAGAVLARLSDFAGDFVVATAGPDLESKLAARGAGADLWSKTVHFPVLHMDIGGGTANLALFQDGELLEVGCLNVGGRLVKFDPEGTVTYVSPVLGDLWQVPVGQKATPTQIDALAQALTQVLEMAAGLRPVTSLLSQLITSRAVTVPPGKIGISFSGGVADCIDTPHPPLAFGDLGPSLGQAIRRSRLCAVPYRLGQETIRATVIGAGCHSAQLSGSTVTCRWQNLPMKNLPVASLTTREQSLEPGELAELAFRRLQDAQDEDTAQTVVLALPGFRSPGYEAVQRLASGLAQAFRRIGQPPLVVLEQDMAKVLGQALLLELPGSPCLCLDRLRCPQGSYLDIGAPVGPALRVVVKTLILSHGGEKP